MSDHLWFEEDDGEPWFYVGNRDYYIKHRMTPDKAERWAAILAAYAAGRPVPARPTGEEGAPFRVFAGPSGEVSYLPDRLRAAEGTGAIDHSHLLACARGVVDFATHEPIDGPLMRALLSALRAACGDSIEDVAVRAGRPREMAPSATPIIDAWRAAGEPAAMTFTAEDAARLTGIAAIFPEPARAPPNTVREEDDTCAPGHHHCARHGGADAVPPSVEVPDPIAALTLAAYNATRAGLDRGTSAKAGIAALMSAYTAGVERAIADYAKARS